MSCRRFRLPRLLWRALGACHPFETRFAPSRGRMELALHTASSAKLDGRSFTEFSSWRRSGFRGAHPRHGIVKAPYMCRPTADNRKLAVSFPALKRKLPRGGLANMAIKTRTPRSSKKPRAARHSWFFLYCAKEKASEDPAGSFQGRKRGRKRGTALAYSRKAAPCRKRSSFSSRRITVK